MSGVYKRLWPTPVKYFSTNAPLGSLSNEDFHWRKQYNSFSQFNIVSFNMLAPCYKRLSTRDLITGRRTREASNFELWNGRAKNTLQFFRSEFFEKKTAIIALQEYWLDSRYSDQFKQEFMRNGYDVHLLQRTGPKVDAVAVIVRTDVFDILGSENVYLCSVADRVALLMWLRHKETGKNLLVVNTHLSFPHNERDRSNQMHQMQSLTSFIDAFADKHNIASATRIVLGDFNVEASSPVCAHLRASGYFSCFEVSPPSNASPETTTDDNNSSHNNNNNNNNNTASNSNTVSQCGGVSGSFQSVITHHMDIDNEIVQPSGSSSPPPLADSSLSGVLTDCEPIADCSDASHSEVQTRADNNAGGAQSSQPQSPSATATAGLEFVSHHTHKEEDLGVDHIFVRPELLLSTDGNNKNGGSDATTRAATSNGPVKSSVFVRETTVLPRSLSCAQWQETFSISDHRPVQASIVLGAVLGAPP